MVQTDAKTGGANWGEPGNVVALFSELSDRPRPLMLGFFLRSGSMMLGGVNYELSAGVPRGERILSNYGGETLLSLAWWKVTWILEDLGLGRITICPE